MTTCSPLHVVLAENVYKCVADGNVTYSSNAASGNCQKVDLQVSQPSPEELARLAAEKKLQQEADDKAAEQEREERLVRAKELDAQAAWRRAVAAEEQARLMREQEQASQAWGYYYPSWWGYGVERPPYRMHRRFSGEPPVPQDIQESRRAGGMRFGFGGQSRAMR